MSTEQELTDPNNSETVGAPATLEESETPTYSSDDSEHDESPIDLEESDDHEELDEIDTSVGEWSLCASMIFLAAYLVLILFWILGHPVWETLISFDTEVYRTEFPVGVATILLLISVLSTFCSFISLVADKNNRKTLLIRLLTLGPVLPSATTGFMIWIIIQRGAGNSILENFLG
jgi:hypothetical protein